MKRYLIMGGAGFLGSNLADALLSGGGEVRIFDRLGIPPYRGFSPDEKMEWLLGDFNSVSDVEMAVQGIQIVYHLISTTLPKTSNDDPIFDVENNVIGTLKLLEAARRAGVEKIIFASSGGTVYGIPEQIPISEDHPTNPLSSYGIGKLAIEKYLRLYHALHGLNYSILRLANPYGERQRVKAAQGAVAVFLHKAMTDLPVEVWGDGSVVRDYIDVSDVVRAMVSVAEYEGEERLFNIGSGCGKSLKDILATIEIILKRPVQRIYKPKRVFDVPVNVLNISRAAHHLDWRPQISFEAGIERFHHWLSSDQSDNDPPVKA